MQILLERQTAAAVSDQINVSHVMKGFPPGVPVTLYLLGEAEAGDEITIQYPDGANWRDSAWVLNLTTPIVSVNTPLEFRVSKDISTNALGVGISIPRGI